MAFDAIGAVPCESVQAAMRACGHCASATLRDKMVSSGQTLMAVTAQLPWAKRNPGEIAVGLWVASEGRPHPENLMRSGHRALAAAAARRARRTAAAMAS